MEEKEELNVNHCKEDYLEEQRFSFDKSDNDGDDDNKDFLERDHWTGKFEFLLAIIGYTVGVGSIWRFPIICAKNGGGAFLIPFLFFLITSGWPLYYLEVCLGQFTGKSAALAFDLCPLFKGLGFLMVMISFLVMWYVMTVMAWTLYFLYNSFFPVLPWTTCDNWWNTKNCKDVFDAGVSNKTLDGNMTNGTAVHHYSMEMALEDNNSTPSQSSVGSIQLDSSPAFEFWRNNVLRRSEGLEEMGSVQIHLLICLFLSYILVVLCVIKGTKTLGKVVYITATAPYILLTIIFIRGLTLEGSVDGIKHYLSLDFGRLADYQVWLEAAIQVFYSLGPTWGGVITMASFNKFHKKSFWDTTITVFSDFFTAFYAGLVVFTVTGFMAKESGKTVDEMAKVSGPGLAFVAYPAALARLPLPQLWTVLFFLMLVTVGLDSFFGLFETVVNCLIDSFPRQLMKRRVFVNVAIGTLMFLLGIPFTFNGGIFLFQLTDWYSSAFALLLGSALECIVVCWIYGADRFSKDIYMMTGREVSVVLRILWVVVTPVMLSIAFITLLSGYSQPDYGDGYRYKAYAISIGVLLGLLPILVMVIAGVWQIVKAKGSIIQRLKLLLKPSDSWGPYDRTQRKLYRVESYEYPTSIWKRTLINIRGEKTTPWC